MPLDQVFSILSSPWAIRPETFQQIIETYERHLAREEADLAAIEAAIGKPLRNEPHLVDVQDGIAVISINGVLAKRMDMFTRISGGSSTQRLQAELAQAISDPQVRGIVLAIDSPGGTVDGTQALANDVFAAREKKPIIAVADGVMASAAYWIGSAAGKVLIASDTTVVGSIGVVIAHTDVSKAQEMRGVKTTEITAGRYKRIASNYAPLSGEGRQSMQEMVDHIYGVFVDSVARNRRVGSDVVLTRMADGRLFLGKQSIDAGLVDGYGNVAQAVNQLRGGVNQFPQTTMKGAAEMQTTDTSKDHSKEPHPRVIAEKAEALRKQKVAAGNKFYSITEAVRDVRREMGLLPI